MQKVTRKVGLEGLRRIAHRRGAARRRRRRNLRFRAHGSEGTDRLQWLGLVAVSLPGLAALAALLFTWMQVGQASKELRISEQGQVTNRFNAAIGNLGSASPDVRLGGIYALQRIMQDSGRDHPPIVSVLAAYVRQHAGASTASKKEPTAAAHTPSSDVRAAIAVLANRHTDRDEGALVDLSNVDLRGLRITEAKRIKFPKADLTDTDLRWAALNGADLHGSVMVGTNLERAHLDKADLRGAHLGYTHLRYAYLRYADLRDAQLYGADVRSVDLDDAHLRWADLRDADLRMADLRRAGASNADLADADLRDAYLIDTDLVGAALTRADLRHADLTNADLSYADLSNADFRDAELTGVNLTGATLTGARGLPKRS